MSAAILLAATQAVAATPRLLRVADVHPESYPTVQAVLTLNDELQGRSKGSLGLQVFPAGQLGSESSLLTELKAGKLDMERVSVLSLDAVSPMMRVLSLPYLFRNRAQMQKVLDGPLGSQMLESLREHGLIGLAFYDGGNRSIYTRTRPVSSIADLHGLRIGVPQSGVSLDYFRLLGAQPIPLPEAQINRALATGLLDAAENTMPAYGESDQYELAPYYSLTRHQMPPDVLLMSRRTWDSLSPEQQRWVQEAARHSVMIMRNMWQQRSERIAASVALNGARIESPDHALQTALKRAAETLRRRYAADPAIRQLIERIQSVQ